MLTKCQIVEILSYHSGIIIIIVYLHNNYVLIYNTNAYTTNNKEKSYRKKLNL